MPNVYLKKIWKFPWALIELWQSWYVQEILIVKVINIYYPGLFELEEGSVLYVRKRIENNIQDPNLDVVVIWSIGRWVDYLLNNEI